jgi:FKBP-type peptidyl-prolyl cis-trans isomerase
MKKTALYTICFAILSLATSCHNKDCIIVKTNGTPELKTATDTVSWAMGFSIAQTIAASGVEPNRELLFEAICATLDSRQQALTEKETFDVLKNLDQIIARSTMEKQESELKEVREREAAYFKELTANNPNIVKSDLGFYYEVIKEGNGPKSQIGQVVTFDYKGSLTNGQIIDQTYGNREPITHIVGEPMMPGLVNGLCLMNEGSIYKFYFPSEMAFGANGGDNIPPYSTLIYEVELHNIRKHNN